MTIKFSNKVRLLGRLHNCVGKIIVGVNIFKKFRGEEIADTPCLTSWVEGSGQVVCGSIKSCTTNYYSPYT